MNATDVFENKMAIGTPFLDSKVLDVNVTGSFSRFASIHHFDSRSIVDIKGGGSGLSETKLVEDGAEVFSDLSGGHRGKEFRLGGTGGGDGLCLRAIDDNTSCIHETIASLGSAVAKIIGMGSINVSVETPRVQDAREG